MVSNFVLCAATNKRNECNKAIFIHAIRALGRSQSESACIERTVRRRMVNLNMFVKWKKIGNAVLRKIHAQIEFDYSRCIHSRSSFRNHFDRMNGTQWKGITAE